MKQLVLRQLLAPLLPIVFLLAPAAVFSQQEPECLVMVRLYWPDHDLSHAQVRVFKDPARKELVAAFPSEGETGQVMMTLPKGAYYLMAVVDLNNDGRLNAGDGLGFSGVQDAQLDQPGGFEVKEQLSTLVLPITLTMSEAGQLQLTQVKVPEPEAPRGPVKLSGIVRGGIGFPTVIYAVPQGGRKQSWAALANEEGKFALEIPAGEYYLFAIQDADDSEGANAGDLVAVHGYTAELGRDFPTVKLEQDLPELALELCWQIGEAGLLKQVQGEAEGPQMALQTLPAVLVGRLEGAPERPALIRAATDRRMSEEVARLIVPQGPIVLAVPSGLYYLSGVSLVADEDGNPGEGSLLGFYGVSDLTRARGPQPLDLSPGERREVIIPMSARLDKDLHPVPLVAPQ